MDEFFLGWEYTRQFHVVTGIVFTLATISAIVVAFFVLVKVYSAMAFVAGVTEWKACECRTSVQRHLCGIFYIMTLETFLMCFIIWITLGSGWFDSAHSMHLFYYGTLIVFVGLIGWAMRSTKHFRGLASCSGSIGYHQAVGNIHHIIP